MGTFFRTFASSTLACLAWYHAVYTKKRNICEKLQWAKRSCIAKGLYYFADVSIANDLRQSKKQSKCIRYTNKNSLKCTKIESISTPALSFCVPISVNFGLYSVDMYFDCSDEERL